MFDHEQHSDDQNQLIVFSTTEYRNLKIPWHFTRLAKTKCIPSSEAARIARTVTYLSFLPKEMCEIGCATPITAAWS